MRGASGPFNALRLLAAEVPFYISSMSIYIIKIKGNTINVSFNASSITSKINLYGNDNQQKISYCNS